ncbi:MAG TPA: hypothetical protein VNO20_02495 [Solirubrobacterales bacterium]|nr:hypothetical protein [Solirubrobacterales bacterium]
MSTQSTGTRAVSPAARVFSSLQADDALLPGQTPALRKAGALFLALLVLGAVPLFWAANAAGLIGDLPAAVAKGSNSGPGGGSDDDDNSGPGGGGDDDDDASAAATDQTSANGKSTRGTTHDNDTNTRTQMGTDDTSRNGNSTRGTTNDNDTNTRTNTNTGTRGGTQTRTRTGS